MSTKYYLCNTQELDKEMELEEALYDVMNKHLSHDECVAKIELFRDEYVDTKTKLIAITEYDKKVKLLIPLMEIDYSGFIISEYGEVFTYKEFSDKMRGHNEKN